MFVLIAGFLVSRGVNVKAMPPVEVVLVLICVNVLATAGCVKFSEVLVSLVSFTINTESVLNLRTGDQAVAPVPSTPCVMSVVLFSVRVATSKSCMCMVTTAIHLACSVSSRHVCCGQCTCTWCLLCTPYSYRFFLQVDALRAVSTRQNKECLTEQWHPCSVNNWVHVHLYLMLFFGDYCGKQFFLQTDSVVNRTQLVYWRSISGTKASPQGLPDSIV